MVVVESDQIEPNLRSSASIPGGVNSLWSGDINNRWMSPILSFAWSTSRLDSRRSLPGSIIWDSIRQPVSSGYSRSQVNENFLISSIPVWGDLGGRTQISPWPCEVYSDILRVRIWVGSDVEEWKVLFAIRWGKLSWRVGKGYLQGSWLFRLTWCSCSSSYLGFVTFRLFYFVFW